MIEEDVDYYELMEVSPNASFETIDRVFRFLAQHYHPDSGESSNTEKFVKIVKAHEVLRDPEKRAAYDVHYQNSVNTRWRIQGEASEFLNSSTDSEIQSRMLSVLYVKRRRDVHNPGIGNLEMANMVGCPEEYLDFHLWYLKEKGWITRLETGLLAITVDGIDHIGEMKQGGVTHLRLMDQSQIAN